MTTVTRQKAVELITIDNSLNDMVISSNEPKRIECGVTDNYLLFRDYLANRTLNTKRSTKIGKDMVKHGNFSSVSCIREGNYLWVWDGQHVLDAAKKAGKHVNYDVYDKVPEDIMILKNKHTKQWTLKDFHKHGLERRLGESLKVERFIEQSKRALGSRIELTATLRLLGDKYSNQQYKNGEFKVVTKGHAIEVLGYLSDFSEYIDFASDSKFVQSFHKVVRTGLYRHKIMLKRLPRAARKMHRQLTILDIIIGIQDCYNYGSHNKVDFVTACGMEYAR